MQDRDSETVEHAGMSETSGRSHVQMLLLYSSIFLTNALRFSSTEEQVVCAWRYLRLIKINMSDILAHDIPPR